MFGLKNDVVTSFSLKTAKVSFRWHSADGKAVKVQRGREGGCCLSCSAWSAVGKTGLIIFVIVPCALVGCQHPTAACTGFEKNPCGRGLSTGRRGEELLQSEDFHLILHLWIAPPSAKKILLLVAAFSVWKKVLCTSMFLLPPLKDFLPWVLPLRSCSIANKPWSEC